MPSLVMLLPLQTCAIWKPYVGQSRRWAAAEPDKDAHSFVVLFRDDERVTVSYRQNVLIRWSVRVNGATRTRR